MRIGLGLNKYNFRLLESSSNTNSFLLREDNSLILNEDDSFILREDADDQGINYKGGRVLIGAGGFVTGVKSHPGEANLVYIHTDVGGAYKLNPATNKWATITNFPYDDSRPGHLYGIEDSAIDPSNPNVIYLACGKFSTQGRKGELLRSTDKGNTWTKLGLDVYFGGNNADRSTGPVVQVSPHDSNHIIVATRFEGIWVTFNGGTIASDWQNSNLIACTPYTQLSSANVTRAIRAIWIDRGNPNVVYAALSDRPYTLYNSTSVSPYSTANAGLYKSTDKGINWTKIPGQPSTLTRINKITQSSNGTIWITYQSGICKYNPADDSFTTYDHTALNTTATPFNAIAVSPYNPLEVTVATIGQYAKARIFRTTDAGSTWSQINYTYGIMPWSSPGPNAYYLTTEVADLTYNNHVASNKPDELYFSTFFGVYKTNNSRAATVHFDLLSEYVEELVTLGIFCPPVTTNEISVPSLITGNADIGGFVHLDGPNNYPISTDDLYNITNDFNKRANYTRTVDFCMSQPNHMAMSGTRNFSPFGNIILVSSDAGRTWTPTTSLPPGIPASSGSIDGSAQAPRIAYSATTPGVFLVSRTSGGEPCLTVNNGNTFITSSSTTKPGSDSYTQFSWRFSLAPNRVNGTKFYYITNNSLWVATWNGSTIGPDYTWERVNNNTGVSTSHVFYGVLPAPTEENHVWLYTNSTAVGSPRLARSINGGVTFTSISGFDKVVCAALGKGATTGASYTVYAFGSRNNVWGIYQSIDLGDTWKRLDIGGFHIGNDPNCMGASLQVFGDVFIGSNGSGVYYISVDA